MISGQERARLIESFRHEPAYAAGVAVKCGACLVLIGILGQIMVDDRSDDGAPQYTGKVLAVTPDNAVPGRGGSAKPRAGSSAPIQSGPALQRPAHGGLAPAAGVGTPDGTERDTTLSRRDLRGRSPTAPTLSWTSTEEQR